MAQLLLADSEWRLREIVALTEHLARSQAGYGWCCSHWSSPLSERNEMNRRSRIPNRRTGARRHPRPRRGCGRGRVFSGGPILGDDRRAPGARADLRARGRQQRADARPDLPTGVQGRRRDNRLDAAADADGQTGSPGPGLRVRHRFGRHIVTNDHVVENADSVSVRFWNGDTYNASVVGTDRRRTSA